MAIFIAPALLAVSAVIAQPLLTFGVAFLLFPLARLVFGVHRPGEPPVWGGRLAFVLERLPMVYAFALVGALGTVLVRWLTFAPSSFEGLKWALSLWVTLIFATCVAHELVHRSSSGDRLMGHVLAGLAGYPLLGYEHLRHHRLAGNTAAAEWPRREESVWRFAGRRLSRITAETVGRCGLAWHGEARLPTVRGLRLALVAMAANWAIFGAAAGWVGIAIFGFVVVLVAFAIQTVTYIQHWGLGDDCFSSARKHEWGWEDDCRFQSWVTLNLSLHQAHHDTPGVPYFRVMLAAASPRLPTGYPLLMFAALVPPLWRRVMEPARTYWMAHPAQPLSSGRRVTCAAVYRRV
ncbi:fatty acid desaturase [Aquabacterium sp. J223]|uniref:fatty acid desaturase n=1 Tax=Aquabacterium sp. J223 TaxID=2898431 RepID=UPI0021ADDF84|nr:fatty acid desaturase [Aquabacterium sp. J223]UUX97308.1 fatty acid desaturase [Aquabacterium sp. J223]